MTPHFYAWLSKGISPSAYNTKYGVWIVATWWFGDIINSLRQSYTLESHCINDIINIIGVVYLFPSYYTVCYTPNETILLWILVSASLTTIYCMYYSFEAGPRTITLEHLHNIWSQKYLYWLIMSLFSKYW